MARIPRATKPRRYVRARKYVSARKAVRKARKTNFVKAVKAVINSQSEDKIAYHSSGSSLVMFNSGIDSTGDMLQLIPNIVKGTDVNERIGDSLTAKSLNVRGYLKLNTNDIIDGTKLPSVVARVMIVSLKYRKSYTDSLYAYPLGGLLKKGGTTTSFSGLISDLNAPINRDLFTVHHDRKFYLNQSFMATPQGTTFASTIVATDIKNTVKFFNFNIKCKGKKLRYDSYIGNDIQPTNFNPIMLIGYSYLDGSTPDSVSTNLGVQYQADFSFEDN